jgi:hypothetical protein
VLENMSTRLAHRIGRRQASEILDILTTVDPIEGLAILRRLSAETQRSTVREIYQDTIRVWSGSNIRGLPEAAVAGERR